MRSSPFRSQLSEIRRGDEVEVWERVDLKAWSALRLGGLADLMIRCGSASAVQAVLDLLASHGRRWHLLGSGSRTVLPDRGLRVPVVALGGSLRQWEFEGHGVVAGGGAKMTQLCRAATLSGRAVAPGSGALAGTLGGSIMRQLTGGTDLGLVGELEWLEAVRPGGAVVRHQVQGGVESGLSDALVRGRTVIVRARLRATSTVTASDTVPDAAVRPTAERVVLDDVFVCPDGHDVTEVLQRSGCRGLASGGARLCENGGNRIVASRRVRSEDIVELIRAVRSRVQHAVGAELGVSLVLVDERGRTVVP
jgi:UDP-N-acetylmuramate dehydrogenase